MKSSDQFELPFSAFVFNRHLKFKSKFIIDGADANVVTFVQLEISTKSADLRQQNQYALCYLFYC
jgi:hypothetical protein